MEGTPQIEELLLRPLRLMTSLQVELIEPRPMTFLWLCKAVGATCLSREHANAVRIVAMLPGSHFPPGIIASAKRAGGLMLSMCPQAEFDPSTQTRLHQGTAVHTNGKSYGFKIPASLQS